MLTWLWKWLFEDCFHKWKVHETINITKSEYGRTINLGKIYVLQCESCGNLKKQEVKPD